MAAAPEFSGKPADVEEERVTAEGAKAEEEVEEAEEGCVTSEEAKAEEKRFASEAKEERAAAEAASAAAAKVAEEAQAEEERLAAEAAKAEEERLAAAKAEEERLANEAAKASDLVGFGKHGDVTYQEMWDTNPGYLIWAIDLFKKQVAAGDESDVPYVDGDSKLKKLAQWARKLDETYKENGPVMQMNDDFEMIEKPGTLPLSVRAAAMKAQDDPKFYGVAFPSPNVYKTWDECKAVCIGVKGARFRSFPTEEEAWEFARNPPPRAQPQPKKPSASGVEGGARRRSSSGGKRKAPMAEGEAEDGQKEGEHGNVAKEVKKEEEEEHGNVAKDGAEATVPKKRKSRGNTDPDGAVTTKPRKAARPTCKVDGEVPANEEGVGEPGLVSDTKPTGRRGKKAKQSGAGEPPARVEESKQTEAGEPPARVEEEEAVCSETPAVKPKAKPLGKCAAKAKAKATAKAKAKAKAKATAKAEVKAKMTTGVKAKVKTEAKAKVAGAKAATKDPSTCICGYMFMDDSVFCDKCGTKREDEPSPVATASPMETEAPVTPPKKAARVSAGGKGSKAKVSVGATDSVLDDATLKKADELGFESALRNLASRLTAATHVVSGAQMIEALVAAGGLVNKAKVLLLDPLAAQVADAADARPPLSPAAENGTPEKYLEDVHVRNLRAVLAGTPLPEKVMLPTPAAAPAAQGVGTGVTEEQKQVIAAKREQALARKREQALSQAGGS